MKNPVLGVCPSIDTLRTNIEAPKVCSVKSINGINALLTQVTWEVVF